MSEAELEQLEREVEAARARVAVDLARLRAPGALDELKEDVSAQITRTKDRVLDGAKEAARDRADGLLSTVKARIAANPGAALAIGAGLAWKLYRHPPVAAVLIGAGIMGLVRADPRHPSMGADAAARAAELAEVARSKTEEWRHRDLAGRIGAQAEDARERLGAVAEAAGERLGALAESARERVGAAVETAEERVGGFAGAARQRAQGGTSGKSGSGGDGGSPYVGPDGLWHAGEMAAPRGGWDSQRDRYLLGAAAFAMAAAVGIAAQRRFAEHQTAHESDFDPRHLPVPVRAVEKASARE